MQPASFVGSMWCRPNSWKPGESISAVVRSASTQYQVVLVVVCLPEFSALRVSPVCTAAPRDQQVDQGALARARGPSTSVVLPARCFVECCAVDRPRQPQRQRQHAVVHALVGQQPLPGPREGLDQVALVQRDERRDALGLGRDQGPRQAGFRRTRVRPPSGSAPGRGWRQTTWCGSRPGGRTGCGAARPSRSCPRRASPATARGRRPPPGSSCRADGRSRAGLPASRPGSGGHGWRPPARTGASPVRSRGLHASSASTRGAFEIGLGQCRLTSCVLKRTTQRL